MTVNHIQTGKHYKLVSNPHAAYWYPLGSKLLLEDVKDNGLTGGFSCEEVPYIDYQIIDFVDIQPWKDAIEHTATSEPICPQCGHIVSTPKLDETKLLAWLDSQIETLARALTQELQDNGNLGDFITGHIVGMQNVRSKILLFRNEGI